MPNDLSPKQKILLQIIKDHRRKYGTAPTLGELRKKFGVQFTNSIVGMLEKLQEKEYIQRAKGIERGITLIEHAQNTVNIRIVGSVACGKPLLAQENTEGYIPVDKTLLSGKADEYFFLRALGDSMDRANIHDGDMLLIKSQSTAINGEKVVALIDDEATVKVLRRGKDFIALVPQSSNPANKPIILHNNFLIQGVVKAIFNKEMLTA